MDKWDWIQLTKKVNGYKNEIAKCESTIERAKESIRKQRDAIKSLKKDLSPFLVEYEAEIESRAKALEEE